MVGFPWECCCPRKRAAIVLPPEDDHELLAAIVLPPEDDHELIASTGLEASASVFDHIQFIVSQHRVWGDVILWLCYALVWASPLTLHFNNLKASSQFGI